MTGLELRDRLEGWDRLSKFPHIRLDSNIRYDSPRSMPQPLAQPGKFYFMIKRALDVTAAALIFAALWPLMAFVALRIKMHDGGPIFFAQTRVGKDGKRFKMRKFRSMVTDAERLRCDLQELNHHGQSITFKIKDDPRITPIGRFIRKTSIDELPQLWNVFRGEMTLVGPRPAVPSEVAQYSAWERRRLEVKPGLTCLWQISGRADLPFPDQVRLDVAYIESQSLLVDCWILCMTPAAVLSGKGAY